MAIGNTATMSSVNMQAGQIAINTRNAIMQIAQFNAYLQSLGQQGLINLGFAADDATALLTIYADMNAVADVCQGIAYPTDGSVPALPYNFVEASIPLWGGQ